MKKTRLRSSVFAGLLLAFAAASCARVDAPGPPRPPGKAPAKPRTVMAGGNGIFGRWIRDPWGLPAYEYTMDETADPRALWDPRLAPPSRLMWFPLGNRRVTAAAYNHGFVQLFYFDSDPRWLNRYDPDRGQYGGGFGFLLEGDRVVSTFHPRRPKGAPYRRVYGTGYFHRSMAHAGLLLEQYIYAPSGEGLDLPVLISEVTVTNTSGRARRVSWYEYWDHNMESVSVLLRQPLLGWWLKDGNRLRVRRGLRGALLAVEGTPVWGRDGGFPGGPQYFDPEPPSVFLASLDGPADGCEFDERRLFSGAVGGTPSAARLAAVSATAGVKEIDEERLCLLLRRDLALAPGSRKTLRFAYGYAKGKRPEEVLARVGGGKDLFRRSLAAWRETLPRFEGPNGNFLSREAGWNWYCMNALSIVDGYFQTPFVPQGGNYLYSWGTRGAVRDLAAYAQVFSYYDHGAARDQLRLILRGQTAGGRFHYGMCGYGDHFSFYYRPSDFGLWVLQAACEYVFVSRDFAFLRERLPFYPKEDGESGTVYEHLRRAYRHLERDVGTGPHGLIRLKVSDWNDEMSFLCSGDAFFETIATAVRGESTLNTAMACYILPRFAGLAEAAGDRKTAADARRWRAGLAASLKKQWREPGWLNRAYSGFGREFGREDLFLEPQIWALLCDDVLTGGQARTLVRNIRLRLMEPSSLGMMLSTRTGGSKTTRPGEQEEGGIWFAMNLPAVVSVARFDRDTAWRELVKNSLAWHADTYPELWMGIWSGPDSFNSVYSGRPGQTWYQQTPLGGIGPQEFPVMNAHAHAQMLYALARLAGLSGEVDGLTVKPSVPAERFSLRTPFFSVRRERDSMEGSFVFGVGGVTSVRCAVPPAWKESGAVVEVDGKAVRAMRRGEWVSFPLRHDRGRPVRWKVGRRE